MVPRTLTWLVGLAVPLLACGTPWVKQPESGSTVVYEPVGRGSPAGPPDRLPTAPAFIEPAREPVEIRRNGSVVRYEPILDGHDEPIHAHTSPGAPIDDEAAGEGLDLPLEDRVGTRPPTRSVAPGGAIDPSVFGVHLTADGLALPYPTTHMFRGFGACRGQRHQHEAIDLGGVGPDWGIGTPIRSMAKAEVIFVGTGLSNPEDFGTPDRRSGEALRGDRMLPRSREIEPYGRVYFFTSRQGRWRSGNLIVTRVLEGPLTGHTIRYLHVAGVHPDVTVGAVVQRGQEIALMGGTGVQESAPHLHLDIQAPNGRRLDVAPLLGLEPTASCRARDDGEDMVRTPKLERSRLHDAPKTDPASGPERDATRSEKPVEPRAPDKNLTLRDLPIGRCKVTTRHEDFSSGRYATHTTELRIVKGQKLNITVGRERGEWKPRLQVQGDALTVKTLASGKIGAKAVTTIAATADTSVRVTIGGWGPELPTDASYALEVSEKCRARR